MLHIISENSALKHRTFVLPGGIRKHLANILNNYKGDKTVNGYKRLKNTLSSNALSYAEMKRIKNFFDHYNGTNKSAEYMLNGGEEMKLWVNNTLNTATSSIKNFKQAMKDAGVKNAFRKPHEKDRQTKTHEPTMAMVSNNRLTKKISNNNTVQFESKMHVNERKVKDISKLIPRRIYNYIEKANAEYEKLKNYTENDDCLLDSDGNFYGLTEPIYINDKYELICTTCYDFARKETYKDVVPLIKYDEENNEYYFDDMWKYDTNAGEIVKDAKRGLRYFEKYDIGKEDEDGEYFDNFVSRLTDESKSNRKTIFLSEAQLKNIRAKLNK